jgi:hypothetical protein
VFLDVLRAFGPNTHVRQSRRSHHLFEERGLFPCASTSVTSTLGRAIAIGIPGKPAPVPTSVRVADAEAEGKRYRAAKSDSPKWRVMISSGSRIAVRFIFAFHFSSSAR